MLHIAVLLANNPAQCAFKANWIDLTLCGFFFHQVIFKTLIREWSMSPSFNLRKLHSPLSGSRECIHGYRNSSKINIVVAAEKNPQNKGELVAWGYLFVQAAQN